MSTAEGFARVVYDGDVSHDLHCTLVNLLGDDSAVNTKPYHGLVVPTLPHK